MELNADIAAVYHKLYPKDSLVVADAHQYLLDNYKNFDFIWSSPPCQSHSSFRQNICVRYRNTPPIYIDMKLYQEIIFLQYNCPDKLWVVENVKPYYKPLIEPTAEVQRHLFWSNKKITPKQFEAEKLRAVQIPQLQKLHGIDLTGIKLPNKRQCLRNCVLPEVGLYVFEEVTK